MPKLFHRIFWAHLRLPIWIGYSIDILSNFHYPGTPYGLDSKERPMSQGKDLPKVIEKTATEIEQAVQSVESSDLTSSQVFGRLYQLYGKDSAIPL